MDINSLRRRRDEVVAQYGPWTAYNIQLGEGVSTMSNDHVGTAEFLINAVVQAVADLVRKPLAELRVLDLACHEGGYAIEFGLHGADVVGIEGRADNMAKATFVAEALDLRNVTFVQGDVRDPDLFRELGTFDVVLCLGILYHLEAADGVTLLERCHDMCTEVTIIRTAIGLTPKAAFHVNGHAYRGVLYREDTGQRGASLDNATSILPTRTSLLNVLSEVGYSSVFEVLNPFVPNLDQARDSVTLAALRRGRIVHLSFGEMNDILPLPRPERRGPPWLWTFAHPQQGLYWRLRERVFHGFHRRIFQSSRPLQSWRAVHRPHTDRHGPSGRGPASLE